MGKFYVYTPQGIFSRDQYLIHISFWILAVIQNIDYPSHRHINSLRGMQTDILITLHTQHADNNCIIKAVYAHFALPPQMFAKVLWAWDSSPAIKQYPLPSKRKKKRSKKKIICFNMCPLPPKKHCAYDFWKPGLLTLSHSRNRGNEQKTYKEENMECQAYYDNQCSI